ncbi:MAG TPA: hypothetical protein VFZ08_09610 [Terriglobia bacterium]|nr:hypothetical protein [Terriglobia bacterium]
MAIAVVPYALEHVPAVKDFNRRLQAGGAEAHLSFYEDPIPRWLPKSADHELSNEFFVAVEGGVVRGAYALKRERFSQRDHSFPAGCYHHPLSEGIIDKAYSSVGVLLIRDALARQPLLYCLGMDGYDKPLPKMLKLLGWSDCLAPFFFKVAHPGPFLKQMEALRETPWKSFLMDLGFFSGGGWLALKGLQGWKQWKVPKPERSTVAEVAEFGDWADALWEEARKFYALAAMRDRETLKRLYPAQDTHFTRLHLSRGGKVIGWAVVGERRKSPRFGDLRVGSVVDCFAAPQDALPVARAAARALEQRGMDVIVSNQSHEAWRQAFRDSGFFEGPSNFIFAASRKLSEKLTPFAETQSRIHLTRADGDGLPRNF